MKKTLFSLIIFLVQAIAFGQISPGDLSEKHAHLEGISNCTQCHVLGDKVTNEKCLACHTEIGNQVNSNKGFHVSETVKGKSCTECHNDHHGREYDLIDWDEKEFDHRSTGFVLEGEHGKISCNKCHKKEFIGDKKIQDKKRTFLGLSQTCTSCHKDYHRETLSDNCTECHGFESFSPAPGFNHDESNFKLVGKHKQLDCIKCHKKDKIAGETFQHFSDVAHSSCTSCHKDVHDNKFGQNCTQCHTNDSFHTIKGMSTFDHSTTGYPLEGMHAALDCKQCHKTSYTDPLNHAKCSSCHKDEHHGQFTAENRASDCQDCHTVKGFNRSTYTLEQHNNSGFKLEGAHMATPCFACHKKGDEWQFKTIGSTCTDCHDNEHKEVMSASFTDNNGCVNCHTTNKWQEVTFDHSKTEFDLSGVHAKTDCAACHYAQNSSGVKEQRFADLTGDCLQCHKDEHRGQFEKYAEEGCEKCHAFNNWEAVKFNHDNCRFKLEGEHKDVACAKCHTEEISEEDSYTKYILNDIECATCHK